MIETPPFSATAAPCRRESMENATPSTAAQERDWSSLPADLLKAIIDLLPWSSQSRLAATCRDWRSVVSPFYPAWLTPVLLNAVDVGATNIRYYSPYYHKNFEVASKTVRAHNAKLCCANGHRLTLCQRVGYELTVVDANLVTGDIRKLHPFDHAGFEFVVYNGAQRMFGISAVCALWIARAIESNDGSWNDWEFSEFDLEGPKLHVSPMTNPVFHRGLLYILSDDGRLAVYDDNRHEEGFKVLDMHRGFGFECDDYYLFESDKGELMAVLMSYLGPPVHVVKFNEQKMEWEKVESLEGRALFTGTITTMMVRTDIKWMQNRIFIPRLYDWPETIQADLVDREGELAFVPISAEVSQHGSACGTSIWNSGLVPQEAPEFWETTKVDYSIWVDFSN